MKIRKLSRSEWMFIIVAIMLVVLIALSWEHVSSRIAEVWSIYKP
ncbi:MAG: hypothetical protein PF590_01645 [Candidatus Delongbacteria bacterium]|jgi:cell division protein FtsL|nr:hypothetical protein [Candidatus Delongbacteria bacterium]